MDTAGYRRQTLYSLLPGPAQPPVTGHSRLRTPLAAPPIWCGVWENRHHEPQPLIMLAKWRRESAYAQPISVSYEASTALTHHPNHQPASPQKRQGRP
jgi:hypothetical protein